MRFKWRRHLFATAFSVASILPFAGCSSQQQNATDEVAADGQQGGGDGDQEASSQPDGDGTTTADDKGAGGDETASNPSANKADGQDVASTNAAPAANGSADGDLKEIISEMNGAPGAQAANNGATKAPAEDGAQAQAQAQPAAPNQTASQPAASADKTSVAGLPEQGSKMAYVVEAGDTLGKIATKVYGDQKRWRDIADLSGMDNPNHIYPGDLVYYSLDDASKSFAASYDGLRRGKEVVREGDTLIKIAQRVYGSAKLWKHIWRQNDGIENPDKLTTGMTVYYIEKDAMKTSSIKSTHTKNVASSMAASKNLKNSSSQLNSKNIVYNASILRSPGSQVIFNLRA